MIRLSKWFAGLAVGLLAAGSVQAQTGGFGQSSLQPRSSQATTPTPSSSTTTPTTSNGSTTTAGTQHAALQEVIAQINALSVFVAAELGITATTPEEQMMLFSITAHLYFEIMRSQNRGQMGFGGGFGGNVGMGTASGFGGTGTISGTSTGFGSRGFGGSSSTTGGTTRGFGGFGGTGTTTRGTASGTGGFGRGSLLGGQTGTTGTTSGRNR